ncbi:hypothetical protein CLUG_00881 [Clavispora lusitaniae ATCC 42720]|uniref:Uncharacterized protein n=1 Tax=Clavispora lusitaniae (strain ATCC 42720) TaxID=306902 RepID=C4XY58_CLAL4|nr:uncharacterized protein CLUG_00881 [Clavispora lusitaniae ATCC 42720]EEQ36758.1 hypothetical protein CLUG_00881 [Clavispora lusitaniae ATCC 42720]
MYSFFLTARKPASCIMAAITAPDNGSFLTINESKSTSGAKAIFDATVEKINRLSLSSFNEGNSIFSSNLPGLNNAGSNVSASLVAMITFTLEVWSKPSIWFNNSNKILCTSRSAPVCASNLFVAMASTSSMKMMAGEFSRANSKTSLTILGPSPKYFCTNSDPLIRINAAVVELATALTNIVLPVPGGP